MAEGRSSASVYPGAPRLARASLVPVKCRAGGIQGSVRPEDSGLRGEVPAQGHLVGMAALEQVLVVGTSALYLLLLGCCYSVLLYPVWLSHPSSDGSSKN